MKLTLVESAEKFNVSPDVIVDYIKNGLVPSKPQLDDSSTELDDHDMYWLDMVHCFIENGSSIDDVKRLVKHCQLQTKSLLYLKSDDILTIEGLSVLLIDINQIVVCMNVGLHK